MEMSDGDCTYRSSRENESCENIYENKAKEKFKIILIKLVYTSENAFPVIRKRKPWMNFPIT